MRVKKTKNTVSKKIQKSEEPMVKVLQVNVNPENPRNGFFELDWNDEFVNMLKQNGYKGETEEEIVDRWFQSLCKTSCGLSIFKSESTKKNMPLCLALSRTACDTSFRLA